MKQHLNQKQLIGYVYQTLADGERETMDHHLAACQTCRARLAEREAIQRRIRYGVLAWQRQVSPPAEVNFEAIAPRVKRLRRMMMFANRSNLVLSSAITVIVLIAVGVGVFTLLSNQPQPESVAEEKVSEQPAVVAIEETSQPIEDEAIEAVVESSDPNSTGAMFRGNPQHTGFYDVQGPKQGDLQWKFEALGAIWSTPAIADGVIYFGSRGNYFYAVDLATGQEKWKFQTRGGVKSSPAIAAGLVYFGSDDHISMPWIARLAKKSGNSKLGTK